MRVLLVAGFAGFLLGWFAHAAFWLVLWLVALAGVVALVLRATRKPPIVRKTIWVNL